MEKLNSLNAPIAKLTATHNCPAAFKRDSTEANGLMAQLYLAVEAEVMLTCNLWQWDQSIISENNFHLFCHGLLLSINHRVKPWI